MKLYLMRHGNAEHRPAQGGGDAARALSDLGRAEAGIMAGHLAARGFVPPVVHASPILRAQQTADLVADILTPGTAVVTLDELSTRASAVDLLGAIARMADGTDLFLVGHEPTMSMATSILVSGGERAHLAYPTATIACIELSRIEGRLQGVLLWLLTPDLACPPPR